MKTLKQNLLILAVVIFAGMFFFSCESADMKGKGTIVIHLPGSSEGGAFRLLSELEQMQYLAKLKYKIICTGPGPGVVLDTFPGYSVSQELSAGIWEITVKAVNLNGREVGSVTKKENVEANKSRSVFYQIYLDEPVFMRYQKFNLDENGRPTECCFSSDRLKISQFFDKPLKSNTAYKITIKGYSTGALTSATGQFYLDGNVLDITNFVLNDYFVIPKGEFECTFTLVTNGNVIESYNQINATFNISSDYSNSEDDIDYETPDNTPVAAITHFNMTIDEESDYSIWEDYKENYAIKISNYSNTDIVAFKNEIKAENIIGGIRAGYLNHGIKNDKNLFPEKPQQFMVRFISRKLYESNIDNPEALLNQLFTQMYVFWNGDNSDQSRAYEISDKLGGPNGLQIINPSNFYVGYRVDGPAGKILYFAPSGPMNYIYVSAGDYMIFPVLQRVNMVRDVIETVVPMNNDGTPYCWYLSFNDGATPQTMILDLNNAVTETTTLRSLGAAYVIIYNASATGVSFFRGSVPMIRPSGAQIINANETCIFKIDIPVSSDGISFTQSITVSNFFIESMGAAVSVKDKQNGGTSFILVSGKLYVILVTGNGNAGTLQAEIDLNDPEDFVVDNF